MVLSRVTEWWPSRVGEWCWPEAPPPPLQRQRVPGGMLGAALPTMGGCRAYRGVHQGVGIVTIGHLVVALEAFEIFKRHVSTRPDKRPNLLISY